MLRERTLSAIVLVPLLLIPLGLGGIWIVAVVAVATGLGARETFRLLASAGFPALGWFGTVLAVALVLETAVTTPLKLWLLLACGAILAAVGAFARPDPRDGLVTWVATLFGAVYPALLGFVVLLGAGSPPVLSTAPLAGLGAERGWIVLLVLGVWSYDTVAYFAGRRFGRTRFLTHISASKTYAGLVGGLVATTIVTGVLLLGLGQPAFGALILGPVLGLAAQAGDLAESMLKRAAGAKDSGTLIPGHGGILDRIDSFLFAAPIVTLYVAVAVR